MRRKEKKINDPELLSQIIRKGVICRLGINDGEKPYIVPVNYGYDGKFIYFHSAVEGKKIDLIKQNNLVCFEIESDLELVKGEKACNWTMNFCSIIGYGRIDFLESESDKINGLNTIMAQYAGSKEWEYNQKAIFKTAVLRISIEEISGKMSGY